MKKITLIIAVVLMAANALFAQVTLTRVWERSDSLYSVTTDILNQKPAYFNDQNTRGIAVGTINSNTGPVDRVFLVSRNTLGNVVRVLNINTGADVKSLNMDATVISGGTFVISDAAMTEDGVLLVSNLNGTGGAGDLKLYKWDNEDGAPVKVITSNLTGRFGDKIAITGKYNDGTARIYVVGGGVLANYKVKYFAMEQINSVWQFKQTPDELNTTISAASSNFHQFNPGPDGGFYFRSVGLNNFQQIKSDLTANIGNTHPTAIAAGSTVPVYIKSAGNYDFACYLRYGSATFAKQSTNQIEVVKIDRTLGVTSAVVVAVSPSFGKLAPGNGAGHVVVKNLPNGDADIYALSTQNGVARFTLTSDIINGIKNTPSTEIKFTKQNGRIIIDSNEVVSIELFNTIGQSVRSVKNSNTVITNNLKGIYILKVKVAGNVVRTEKINL